MKTFCTKFRKAYNDLRNTVNHQPLTATSELPGDPDESLLHLATFDSSYSIDAAGSSSWNNGSVDSDRRKRRELPTASQSTLQDLVMHLNHLRTLILSAMYRLRRSIDRDKILQDCKFNL
jgi:hypothetical protein